MLGNAPFCSQFFAAEKLKEMLLDRRGVQGGGGGGTRDPGLLPS